MGGGGAGAGVWTWGYYTVWAHYNKLRDISIEAERFQNAPQKGAQSGIGFYTHSPFYELISPRIYLYVQKNLVINENSGFRLALDAKFVYICENLTYRVGTFQVEN